MVNLNTVINSVVNSVLGGPVPSAFSTQSVTNTRTVLYTISIRAPGTPQIAYQNYIFPLSPSNLSKEFTTLTNIYDVAGGTASIGGVQRIVDNYGTTPVMYTIEGTTGWQYHSTDGFGLTGIDSIITIQNLLYEYANLNQVQMANQQPLYTLEFYDYFMNDYWQVEPIGKQEIRQSRDRPLLAEYMFRFAGIADLTGPNGIPVTLTANANSLLSQIPAGGLTSTLATTTITSTPQVLQATQASVSSYASQYSYYTAGATALSYQAANLFNLDLP